MDQMSEINFNIIIILDHYSCEYCTIIVTQSKLIAILKQRKGSTMPKSYHPVVIVVVCHDQVRLQVSQGFRFRDS